MALRNAPARLRLDQRLPWGILGKAGQLGGNACPVGFRGGASEAFAKFDDFLVASAAAADFRTAAGCRHELSKSELIAKGEFT